MQDFHFDEAVIEDRYKDIFDIANSFCDDYNIDQEVKVEIDPSLLYLAVVATYDDVARYKSYHLKDPEKEKSDPIKRAAYAVKWLMHFSPLIFPQMGHVSGGRKVEDADTLANAMFALHYALTNLRSHANTNFKLQTEMHFELIYDLLYRRLTTASLIILFDVFCKLAEDGVAAVID